MNNLEQQIFNYITTYESYWIKYKESIFRLCVNSEKDNIIKYSVTFYKKNIVIGTNCEINKHFLNEYIKKERKEKLIKILTYEEK